MLITLVATNNARTNSCLDSCDYQPSLPNCQGDVLKYEQNLIVTKRIY